MLLVAQSPDRLPTRQTRSEPRSGSVHRTNGRGRVAIRPVHELAEGEVVHRAGVAASPIESPAGSIPDRRSSSRWPTSKGNRRGSETRIIGSLVSSARNAHTCTNERMTSGR